MSAATKAALRERMRAMLKACSPDESAAASFSLAKNLMTIPAVSAARTVMLYMPVRGEISPLGILASGKLFYLPVTGENGDMSAVLWNQADSLRIGRYGIAEPEGAPAGKGSIDVIIAPALAISRDGARIGSGFGYYDRFLSDYNGLKIAVAHDFQLVCCIPRERHDVLMDIAVTPSGVYKRSEYNGIFH